MLAEVLHKVDEIGRSFSIGIHNVFHAGDGNVHPIFLYDDRDEGQVQNTLRASEEVLKYCIDIGGTLTGEHGVGVEKIHLMPHMFDRATMEQFQRVKHAFDPQERINAGKLLPSERVRSFPRQTGATRPAVGQYERGNRTARHPMGGPAGKLPARAGNVPRRFNRSRKSSDSSGTIRLRLQHERLASWRG